MYLGFFILFFSLEDIGTLLVYYWYNNIIQPTPDSTHNTMVKTLSSRAIRLRYQGKNASSQDVVFIGLPSNMAHLRPFDIVIVSMSNQFGMTGLEIFEMTDIQRE